MTAANGVDVSVENENLLSSPNQPDESQAEAGAEETLSASPRIVDSSSSASDNTSNANNVDHAKVVEAVQRVVQEVREVMLLLCGKQCPIKTS